MRRLQSTTALGEQNPPIHTLSSHFKEAPFDLLKSTETPQVPHASVAEAFHRLTSHLHSKAAAEIPAAQKSKAQPRGDTYI